MKASNSKMLFVSACAFTLIFTKFTFASEYRLVNTDSTTSGIEFEIGYTAGVHRGKATQAKGFATVSVGQGPLSPMQIESARVSIPLLNLTTDNQKRDCHMREALGINYSTSKYPKEHVCNNSDQLPTSGPDSVVYPEIRFDLNQIKSSSGGAVYSNLVAGESQSILLVGRMSMHGYYKDIQIPAIAKVAENGSGAVNITASGDILLNDFGIVVMPFLFITVRDKATFKLNLNFEQN